MPPRVSKFVVENVFNNSHIEYNNECDNNDNKNDNGTVDVLISSERKERFLINVEG